ncbi:hypothetical protein VTN00DRAFT_2736 [Thermoascus crustaceus]|uniref:uncharacterized protein n=1 Tax=Thermoascus crustaceus TaxID=5088 RepID=UPI0037448AF9
MLYKNNLKSCCPVCLKGYARDDKTTEHVQKDHKGSPIAQTKSSLGDEYHQMTEGYKSILLSYVHCRESEIPEPRQLFEALYLLVYSSHQSCQEVDELLQLLLSRDGFDIKKQLFQLLQVRFPPAARQSRKKESMPVRHSPTVTSPTDFDEDQRIEELSLQLPSRCQCSNPHGNRRQLPWNPINGLGYDARSLSFV